jgi:hypothetical protein
MRPKKKKPKSTTSDSVELSIACMHAIQGSFDLKNTNHWGNINNYFGSRFL